MNPVKYFLADYLIHLRIHTSMSGYIRVSKMADEHIQNCINLADTSTRPYWQIAKPIFEKEMKRRDKKRTVFVHSKIHHCKPGDILYNGGWARINTCSDCKRIAFFMDMTVINPCPACGGLVIGDKIVGVWDIKENKWITKPKAKIKTKSKGGRK